VLGMSASNAGTRVHRARSLLRRLERADTDREASALRRQLTLVAGVVRSLRRQLDELGERTDYARVSVTLTDESWDGSGDGIGAALEDALASLGADVGLAIRALGVLLPRALVAALAWLAVSTFGRRRRESALR
jgi:hypothetical protein